MKPSHWLNNSHTGDTAASTTIGGIKLLLHNAVFELPYGQKTHQPASLVTPGQLKMKLLVQHSIKSVTDMTGFTRRTLFSD